MADLGTLGDQLLHPVEKAHDDDPAKERKRSKKWCGTVALYMLYAALFSFKPSEAFLVDFILSRGVDGAQSETEISRQVFSVFTYTRMPALLMCLFLCRFWGCKAVVAWSALCGLATTALTIAGPSLAWLQLSQALASFAFAGHVAFDALQFSRVEPGTFRLVSHLTKGAELASCCVSSVLGQLLRQRWGERPLFAVTLAFEALAVLVALCLQGAREHPEGQKRGTRGRRPFSAAWRSLWHGEVFRWTLVWVFCYAGHDLVLTNWQILAEVKLRDLNLPNLNGYTWSAAYLASAAITLAAAPCDLAGGSAHTIQTMAPLAMAAALFGMASSRSGALGMYSSFVVFQCAFQVTAAVRNASVASEVSDGSKGGGGGGEGGGGGVDPTFVLSAVLWAASGAGLGLEAAAMAVVQSAARLSFADASVWLGMSSCLGLVGVGFGAYFTVRSLRGRRLPFSLPDDM